MRYKALYAVMVLSTTLVACSKHQETSTNNASHDYTLDARADKRPGNPVAGQEPATKPLKLALHKVKIGSLHAENPLAAGQIGFKENTSFGRNDSVHLILETIGSGKATLTAHWAYMAGGKQELIGTSSQVITAFSPNLTQLSMHQEQGWKLGSYRIEIWLDDALAAVKEFRVE